MTIYEKLGAIQQALKAPKDLENEFGGYRYRSAESILEAVKPLLKDNKCVLLLHDQLESIEGRVYIKATAQFFDAEAEKPYVGIEVTAFAREEESKKGMDASQVTGAASSYARKYALNGLFCIDDNKDSDYTNQTPKEERKPDETRSQASDFPFCQDCGERIDERVRKYSVDKFGVALCRDCQKRRN